MRMRRGLAVLLALVMALSLIPTAALAAEPEDAEGLLETAELPEETPEAVPEETVEETSGQAEAPEEIETSEQAEAPAEAPEETPAQLLQARIDALPEADAVAELMDSAPEQVDAVYEEIRALAEAVEALEEPLDTTKLDALVELFTPEAEVLEEPTEKQAAITVSDEAELTAAVQNIADGGTITLSQDITLIDNIPIKIVDKGTVAAPITLDFNGFTISGSNANTGTAANSTASGGILWLSGSYINLGDTSSGEKGGIVNTTTATGATIALLIASTDTNDGAVTVNDGVKVKIEQAEGNKARAIVISGKAAAPAKADVTINNIDVATASYTISSESTANKGVIINGGKFVSINMLNGASSFNGYLNVVINGGTFYNWSESTNTAKVADGHTISMAESDGKYIYTVIPEANAPAEYVASMQTSSGKTVYMTEGSNLYGFSNIQSLDKGTIHVAKDADLTVPANKALGNTNFGDTQGSTLILELEGGVKLTGTVNLNSADVIVTGDGDTSGFSCAPSDPAKYEMISNGEKGVYSCRRKVDSGEATLVKADGTKIGYAKAAGAMTAAEDNPGSVVKLNKNSSTTFTTNLGASADVTLDLNGYTFTFTNTGKAGFELTDGAKLTIINSNESKTGTFVATGRSGTKAHSAILTKNPGGGTIVIGENVTVKGPIVLLGEGSEVTVAGTVDATSLKEAAIYGNGTAGQGNTKITIQETAMLKADSNALAIYHPQAGTLVVNGGTIEGGTGIEMRAGTLTVNGGTITGTADNFDKAPNGSGSTILGAGIAVSQHGTNLPISVTIQKGGETAPVISGQYALYEEDLQDELATDQITINIKDGDFKNTGADTKAVYSENVTGFISGGYYTSDPSEYVVEGKDVIDSDKPGYDYMIGIRKVDVETAVAAGDAAAEVQITDTNVTADAVKEAANDTETQTSLTDAAKASGMSNDKSVVGTEKNAEEKLAAEKVTVNEGDTITVVIQPYLDVKVQDAQTAGPEKSMTVDIKALYDVVATTAESAEDIRLEATDSEPQNAVILKPRQTMKVTTPVTIKLPLPTGFVSTTSDPVFVQHDGKYEYTATVTGDTTNGFTAEFINPHGFSTFVLSTKSAAVAKIGENSYTTLQAAVDAVENGGTIDVLTADQAAKVNSAKSFTLTGAGKDTASITAGSGLTVSEKDDVYTAVKRPSSSGSGSDDDDGYTVTVEKSKHGDVTVSPRTAEKGETVTITVKPDKGYRLYDLTVTAKNGKELGITQEKSNKFTFKMPDGAVTVEAAFVKTDDAPRFIDVPDGYWAEGEIEWAAGNGYMNGNTDVTFNPEGLVTRQQLWMILARLSGYQPADFAEARIWAMNSGVSDGTFPGRAVSRQQLVTILYRYARLMGYDVSVGEDTNILSYHDAAMVSEYAIPAMQWATGAGIVQGTGEGNLMPLASTTRAQFAVILSRFCEDVVE